MDSEDLVFEKKKRGELFGPGLTMGIGAGIAVVGGFFFIPAYASKSASDFSVWPAIAWTTLGTGAFILLDGLIWYAIVQARIGRERKWRKVRRRSGNSSSTKASRLPPPRDGKHGRMTLLRAKF